MARVTIRAGDFVRVDGRHSFGSLVLNTEAHPSIGATILIAALEVVEVAPEERVKKLGGTVGWRIAGGILLGPVGLRAGLLVGGRTKQVTFVAKFKDGRRLLATTYSKTFTELQAACC